MLKNIFEKSGIDLEEEYFEDLLKTNNFRVERIISKGHTSAENDWYDQDENEFVLLLKGEARLEYFEGNTISLKEGDWLIIPPHKKHRVDWTLPDTETFWLTIFY